MMMVMMITMIMMITMMIILMIAIMNDDYYKIDYHCDYDHNNDTR